MSVQMICCSHSPLMLTGIEESQGDSQAAFFGTMETISRELQAFAPDVVVMFAPDHFNGFFYEMMPPFCMGTAAEGSRDWGAEGGPLRVPRDLAMDCVRHLHGKDFDISISHDMKVDHGLTIPLVQLTGALARYDVLPVFINCAADPRPSMRRIRQLGAEIGRFLATQSLRVAVLGSGGLSHDPPTPRLAKTSYEVARRLIKRATPSVEELQAREARVVKAARDLVVGRGPCMPPDVAWDQSFMRHMQKLDFDALDAIDDFEIDTRAGFGGHEVRCWVAAAAAAQEIAGGTPLTPKERYYDAIPEWLTGMGVMTAEA
ncbi:3-carboxyethylcatechol 2,3-dioxygenase [Diaphorobacter caeni]|uniref:3-carboxyethylcatechol 2,3-dioxygenase n=1 Tax=Diaphorobacter caeni TaxID=2784387 RepID=UPI00188F94B0|nr:3-carboxyethylcatechol 2,3-dioxygenase [Diaphorobacter caeni]MBF5007742.1 3-carboxyethylcatechol 2,3-dioxygenase [Diaphorobacter caeni]